ncbi:TolC family protein [Maribellus comscasis]|uniref:TolC family protein n=1 Tax=Maribellus comscasis TaxID=2681766 RepID=A0A6I6JZR4_9BACT|nr:TolC family protein [Maribellus comscasis]QGY46670.1 TolC family protein [Maribellus comscasis]
MKRKQITFFILGLLLFHGVYAQEKLTLDIEAAKEYALNFNKTVKNSGLSVVQSQEQLREAIASGLPQVNATTDYSNSLGAEISIQFDENAPASKIPIKPTSNFNLQVGQLIFNGSYIVGIQTAKLYQKMTEKNLEKTEQDIVSQVIESYYLVLVSGESLKILEANMENLREIYKKTEPMVSVGMMEKVELDQLSVQVNSLSNALKSAERQYEMTQNMLRLQLGVSADTELELTEKLGDIMGDTNLNPAVEGSFDIVQNIDYQLMNVQEDMSEKQVDLQKAAYLPTVSGYYNYTYKILKPAFDMSPAHMVGLQMNIPVFSSGERRAKVRQAKIDLETAKNNKAMLEDQLSIQYKQLKFNLLSAIESFETQKKNVEVSREVYKSLKTKYEQGVISSLELTTADNNYLNAESDYLTSMLEVLRAQNELNTLTGIVNN